MSEGNGYVTREQMLAPLVRVYIDVTIPGLGKVEIQNISEGERAKVESYNYRKNGAINVDRMMDVRSRLCVVGTTKPQLTMADVEALRNKDAGIIDRLANAINAHCDSIHASAEEVEKKATTPGED